MNINPNIQWKQQYDSSHTLGWKPCKSALDIGKTKHEPNQPIFGVQELEKIVESFRSQATRMVELERLCSTQLQKAPRENAAPAFQNFSSMGCTVSCFLVSVIISIGFL